MIGAPVPPFEPWYEDLTELYPYDPDAARALLEEAGYGDGLELSFVVPNIYPTVCPDYVVSQLADVGITVNLQTVEFPTWIDQVYVNHDYDLTVVLHVEPRDIDNYANPEYYWLYDSPEVQDLLGQREDDAGPRGVRRAAPAGRRADRRGGASGVAAAVQRRDRGPHRRLGLPDVRRQRPLRRLRHHRGELTIALAARSACPPTSTRIG